MAKAPTGKSKLRREEVRRQRSETTASMRKSLRDQIGVVRPAIALGFFALSTLAVLYGRDPFPYQLGQEVQGPIFARVYFEIPDREATNKSRDEARLQTPNYYVLNSGVLGRITAALNDLYTVAQDHETYDDYLAAKSEVNEQDQQGPRWQLSQVCFEALHGLSDDQAKAGFNAQVQRLMQNLKRERLVLQDCEAPRKTATLSAAAIFNGALPNLDDRQTEGTEDVEVNKVTLEYFSDDNLRDVERAAATLSAQFSDWIRPNVAQILEDHLKGEALFRFDLERTHQQMEQNATSKELVADLYDAYSILAMPKAQARDEELEGADGSDGPPPSGHHGGRYRLTTNDIRVLQAEHEEVFSLLTVAIDSLSEEKQQVAQELRQQRQFMRVAGGAMVFLVTLGMIAYCGMFQPRVIQNPVRALSIAGLFLVMLALSRLAVISGWTVAWPHLFVGPVVVTAAILTMVYSQRFAIGMTGSLAILITIAVRGDLGLLLVLAASAAVAVYQLREIRSRNELFSTGLLNGLTAFIVCIVVWLMAGYSLESAWTQAVVTAATALGAIAVFFLFLPPIERIFKVATNWTLLELLDTSKPLLSRLARDAPGTFAHSLWLSNMAESACEAVAANSLLAKVGAMYHDIGKVHKAEYFAENQEANINRHDNLSPTMSLLVIIGHVKDGVELAKAENLPSAVIRFIEEHHGTTVVRYFHHVASEQQKAAGNPRGVSESEFRYPGPKPQSKETAVLMLCDGVEGAVRALQEPTAGRIETVVHNVLMDRLNDGQFDNCEITLKDLHRIEESLVKSLCRFYHGRITYPKSSPEGQNADSQRRATGKTETPAPLKT